MSRRLPTCQFCGYGPDHIPDLTIDPETKRCTYCEPEWAALTTRYRDGRTITRHWRARTGERMSERQWAMKVAAQRAA